MGNSVELCIPVTYEATLGESLFSEYHGGTTYDFAYRDVVPDFYNTTLPPALSAAQGTVPGNVGSVLWLWESDSVNGRLRSGRARYTPVGLTATRRKGGGGTQLCAKVFNAGRTYCPISRLRAKTYTA